MNAIMKSYPVSYSRGIPCNKGKLIRIIKCLTWKLGQWMGAIGFFSEGGFSRLFCGLGQGS
jgi:hypothetical protein